MIPLKDNVPARGIPWVTLTLIALSLLAMGWQLTESEGRASTLTLGHAGVSERDALTIERGAIPARLTDPGRRCEATPEGIVCAESGAGGREGSQAAPENLSAPPWWTTPFTAILLQVSLSGAALLVIYLLVFGRTLEASLGRVRFAALYVVSGLAAIALQTLLDPEGAGPILGAAGALAGTLGAYVAGYPRARVLGLVPIPIFATLVQIPAVAIVAAWFVLQLLPDIGSLATPDVADPALAYAANLATFALGFAAGRLLIRRPLAHGPPLTLARNEPAHG